MKLKLIIFLLNLIYLLQLRLLVVLIFMKNYFLIIIPNIVMIQKFFFVLYHKLKLQLMHLYNTLKLSFDIFIVLLYPKFEILQINQKI